MRGSPPQTSGRESIPGNDIAFSSFRNRSDLPKMHLLFRWGTSSLTKTRLRARQRVARHLRRCPPPKPVHNYFQRPLLPRYQCLPVNFPTSSHPVSRPRLLLSSRMSTTAQILANQHNASLSTGPSSPEGKAASSRNATTHGLSGHFAVLPHEDSQAFDRLIHGYFETFQPHNDHESFLIQLMVQSRWKLARLQRVEAALIQQMVSQDTDRTNPDAVIVAAMLAGNANAYASLQRYMAAAERSYYKAKQELERGRAHEAQAAAPKPVIRPVQNEPKSTAPAPINLVDFMRKPNATLADLEKLGTLCQTKPDDFDPLRRK